MGESLGDVDGTVACHHPGPVDPLGVEPGDYPAEEADHGWLLVVPQHRDVSQPGGVVDGDMDLLVPDPVGASLLAITGDPMPHLAKSGKGLDVHGDPVTRPLPRVPLYRRPGFQVSQSP